MAGLEKVSSIWKHLFRPVRGGLINLIEQSMRCCSSDNLSLSLDLGLLVDLCDVNWSLSEM